MNAMTSTASPRRLPSTGAAAGTFAVTPADGSGETAVRVLEPVNAEVRAEPPPAGLLSYAGRRRQARLSTGAIGPTTPEAA
jgi:hypothetical protein